MIFSLSILHIRLAVKGKPVERRGRKATGLLSPSRFPRRRHDSGVARMYNTNLFYVPSTAHHPGRKVVDALAVRRCVHRTFVAPFFAGREGMIE